MFADSLLCAVQPPAHGQVGPFSVCSPRLHTFTLSPGLLCWASGGFMGPPSGEDKSFWGSFVKAYYFAVAEIHSFSICYPGGPGEGNKDLSPFPLPRPKGRSWGRGKRRRLENFATPGHTYRQTQDRVGAAHLHAQVHTCARTASTWAGSTGLPTPTQGTWSRR